MHSLLRKLLAVCLAVLALSAGEAALPPDALGWTSAADSLVVEQVANLQPMLPTDCDASGLNAAAQDDEEPDAGVPPVALLVPSPPYRYPHTLRPQPLWLRSGVSPPLPPPRAL